MQRVPPAGGRALSCGWGASGACGVRTRAISETLHQRPGTNRGCRKQGGRMYCLGSAADFPPGVLTPDGPDGCALVVDQGLRTFQPRITQFAPCDPWPKGFEVEHLGRNPAAAYSSDCSAATTLKSSRVVVSPFTSPPAAISLRIRRMIFPLRVLGRPAAKRIMSGLASEPISLPT